jgi:hypothetical protein
MLDRPYRCGGSYRQGPGLSTPRPNRWFWPASFPRGRADICEAQRLLAAFCQHFLAVSGLSDDESVTGGLDHFARDGRELVDLEDARDLGKEAVDEAEVAVGDASDGSDGFAVGEVVGAESQAEPLPVVGQDEAQLVGTERFVAVGEADAAVEAAGSARGVSRGRACRSGSGRSGAGRSSRGAARARLA